jgi:hypothetical protein
MNADGWPKETKEGKRAGRFFVVFLIFCVFFRFFRLWLMWWQAEVPSRLLRCCCPTDFQTVSLRFASGLFGRPPHRVQEWLNLLGQRGIAVLRGKLIRLFEQR